MRKIDGFIGYKASISPFSFASLDRVGADKRRAPSLAERCSCSEETWVAACRFPDQHQFLTTCSLQSRNLGKEVSSLDLQWIISCFTPFFVTLDLHLHPQQHEPGNSLEAELLIESILVSIQIHIQHGLKLKVSLKLQPLNDYFRFQVTTKQLRQGCVMWLFKRFQKIKSLESRWSCWSRPFGVGWW